MINNNIEKYKLRVQFSTKFNSFFFCFSIVQSLVMKYMRS